MLYTSLFICKFLFYSAESKLNLDCCNNNNRIHYIHSQNIYKPNLPTNISKYGHNLKSSEHLNVSQSNLSFWEVCHLTFIKKYDHIVVYVLSNDHDGFKHQHFYDEFGLVELYSTVVETSKQSKVVIIFINAFDELHKLVHRKTTLWNQDSIFVIVILECLLEVKFVMEALWKYHKIYKYVLLCGMQNPVLYIYRPFVQYGEKVFEVKDETEIVDNIVHAMDDLYGSIVRIVLFPQDFFAITDNGKYIGGGDYSSLETLTKKMNFCSQISPPTDGNKFTQTGKNVTGSMRDIILGLADIAVNGHFLKHYDTDEITLSHYVYMDKLCFVVPLPSYYSPYTLIMQIFPKSIWVLIALVYFTAIVVYYLFELITKTKHNKSINDGLWLQTFAMFIFGATSLKTNNNPKKLLIGGLLLNILIVNNIFQGSLMTVLSKPTRKRSIETLDQIIKSDLALVSDNFERLIDDPKLLQSLYRLKERKLSESVNVVRIQRFPLSHVQGYRNHLRFRNNNVTESLHIVSEFIKSDFVSFVLPKNSPFLDRINLHLIRFQESGLTGKWLGKDISSMIQKTYKPLKDEELEPAQTRSFTFKDLTFIFNILLIGLGVSAIVFCLENILGKKLFKCSKPPSLF